MPPLEYAASALGWHGAVISNVPMLGRRVSAVVRVREDVHQWRSRNGWPPQPDSAWLGSWSVPSAKDRVPLPAVDLIGALVTSPPTDRALHACGTLLTLAPCVIVVPDANECDPWRLTELHYYGVGVVSLIEDGVASVVIAPENRSAEFGQSPFGLRLLEVLYERMLETPQPPPVPRSEQTRTSNLGPRD